MTDHGRRSLLATAGTALAGTLAGCSTLEGLSSESTVEYDDSALAALPGDVPEVPAPEPVQPTPAHLEAARDRVRSSLAGTDLSRVPNAVVRQRLDRERDSARDALAADETGDSRVEALAGLTHPRAEAMFVQAGLAAFDGRLTATDLTARRDRQQREATAFLDDYRYVGSSGAPAETLAEHARIVEWATTGSRLLEPDQYYEYENTVLHRAELARDIEWGRAYAADARRLRDHYVSTLADTTDYTDRFAGVADGLVVEVETHAAAPDWETLTSDFERDIENTAAERLLEELARRRWSHAETAVEADDDAGDDVLTISAAMHSLVADRAFAAVTEAVEAGAYETPESVDPIAAERTAAVEQLQTLLDTEPAPLASRLASRVATELGNADRQVRQERVSAPASYLYAEYALANQYAAAAPPVIRRVGVTLDG
ncbi:hypothetical protein [Salinirubrum litoreum]|uniref:DUF885 domain-containing protein n=1 Tax=Salinirubrum litoreum TaxID=1126234 RepID=A0ABD5RH79_9EURY|nr:hypothetical protein [Salinirubrum litoreum]